MVIPVPLIPVPIATDSELLAVSITRYASEPCLIVKAVAELSLTATLISVPSALILSRAISFTFVILLSPNEVAPSVTDPVVLNALEPISIAPNPLEMAPAPRVPTEVICVWEASTPITELEAVKPVPANRVATSAIASLAWVPVAPPSRNKI